MLLPVSEPRVCTWSRRSVPVLTSGDDALVHSAGSGSQPSLPLVQVIPMLPRLLCEELCSLNPLSDRLTFSVIWKITPEGKVELLKTKGTVAVFQ